MNLLRWRLFEPAAREFYVDWDEATEILVNGLRELSGHCPLDPRMRALIAELSDTSPRFRELWGRAEVGDRLGTHHIRHPQVGDLYLCRHKLIAPYPGGDHILMYRAEPGSESAKALERLRSMAGAQPVVGVEADPAVGGQVLLERDPLLALVPDDPAAAVDLHDRRASGSTRRAGGARHRDVEANRRDTSGAALEEPQLVQRAARVVEVDTCGLSAAGRRHAVQLVVDVDFLI